MNFWRTALFIFSSHIDTVENGKYLLIKYFGDEVRKEFVNLPPQCRHFVDNVTTDVIVLLYRFCLIVLSLLLFFCDYHFILNVKPYVICLQCYKNSV